MCGQRRVTFPDMCVCWCLIFCGFLKDVGNTGLIAFSHLKLVHYAQELYTLSILFPTFWHVRAEVFNFFWHVRAEVFNFSRHVRAEVFNFSRHVRVLVFGFLWVSVGCWKHRFNCVQLFEISALSTGALYVVYLISNFLTCAGRGV